MSFRSRLEQQLDAFLVDVSQQKITYEKENQFRVSSFPFCPLRAFLYETRTDSFSMDFYTSIGTAVHESIQKWAILGGYQDKIFCCWKAVETGEVYGPCFKRDLPKSWDNYTLEYEEITIEYKGLSGHVDLVLEIFPGKFIVVDFKTTDLGGAKRKSGAWHNQYPASQSSIIQISSYCTLLKKLFKLNIVAWSLVYVDRGKVIRSEKDYYKVTRPWHRQKHQRMINFINQACENHARLEKLQRVLAKSDNYNPKAVSLLKELVRNRPCTDEQSYEDWMRYKFSKWDQDEAKGYKKGSCLHKNACLSGSKVAYKTLMAKL